MLAEPVPEAGTTVAHAALRVADQLQAWFVAMLIVVLPPAAGSVAAGPATENRHGAAPSETVACAFATAMAAWRATGSGLAATLYGTDPLPCPLVAAVS